MEGRHVARRVMGIDPGTVRMGYGVVEDGDRLTMAHCGVIAVPAKVPLAARLHRMYSRLLEIIACYQPTEISVEQPFVAKNARSALAVGRAEAVAMLAAASSDIPIYSYAPSQVKLSAASYGGATKEQVQEMVRIQLGLPSAPQPSDAADALAVAICHIYQTHLTKLVDGGGCK